MAAIGPISLLSGPPLQLRSAAQRSGPLSPQVQPRQQEQQHQHRPHPHTRSAHFASSRPGTAKALSPGRRDFLSPRDALTQVHVHQHRLNQLRANPGLTPTPSGPSHQSGHDTTTTPSTTDEDGRPPRPRTPPQEFYLQPRASLDADTSAAPDPWAEDPVASSSRRTSTADSFVSAASFASFSSPRTRIQKPSMGRSKLDRLLGPRIDWQLLPTLIIDCILEQLRLFHVNKMSSSCTTCYMRDLCAMQVVCRRWELPAQRMLYSHIQLLGEDDPIKLKKMKIQQGARLTLLRRTLRSRPYIASLVKGLHVPAAPVPPFYANGGPNAEYDEYIGLLASLVMACPNLETLEGFYPVYNHAYDRLTHALSTRMQLRQHVWIIGQKDSLKGQVQKQLGPDRAENRQVYEFLQYHRNWDKLQTLMLCSQASSGFVNHKAVIKMFESLPALQNLCLKSFKSDEFNDETLMILPRLQELRLEECAGVTDAGLVEWASSSASIFIKKLGLIHQDIARLETIAKILSQLIQLRRFAIVQNDTTADVRARASAAQPLLSSETMQFLHWDIGADASALRLYEEHEDADLKDLAGKEGLHANVHLALSISRGGFPSLTHLRAPQDVCPSGVLQSVCRPARNGKIVLSGDKYATPRMDPGSNANCLRAARIRAQGVIARHIQKRKAWMKIVITDHSHQDPYIPPPLSASTTGSSPSMSTASTDMTEVEDDSDTLLQDRHTGQDTSKLMPGNSLRYPSVGHDITPSDPSMINQGVVAAKSRDNSPPPKKWSRSASTLLSPIKIPPANQSEERSYEPLKVREHILPTFAGRVSVHMDEDGQIFHPPRFYLLPDIPGHDENGGIVGWDEFIRVKERTKPNNNWAAGEEDEDRDRSKDGCDGSWNKWVTKEDPNGRKVKEAREHIRDSLRKIRPRKFKTSPIQSHRPTEPIKESPAELLDSPPPQAARAGQARTVQARRQLLPPHVRKFLGWVFVWVPIVTFALTHIPFGVMTVTGGSMRPLFNPASEKGDGEDGSSRDKMLVLLQGHWKKDDIERGEIVVFRTPHDPNKIAVKRVVALAGDKVLPLEGYDLTEEERQKGVLIPFNHMWVEGDVDDRSKSVDSNWYGPISQNLVIGRAKVLLTPWWRPRWIRVSEHTWPAEEKRRVKYSAVEAETLDPDYRAKPGDFAPGGPASMALADFKSDPQLAAERAQDNRHREKMVVIYQRARDEWKRQDEETKAVAGELIKEIEKCFWRAGGSIEYPVFPELKWEVLQEKAREKEETERKLAAVGLGAYSRMAREERERRKDG
ncbi:hypothetical protein DV735_g541, partial [Chaetothyriales sp. CBS 134920]